MKVLLFSVVALFSLVLCEQTDDCVKYTINHNYQGNPGCDGMGDQGLKGQKGERGHKGDMGISNQPNPTGIPKSCAYIQHTVSGVYLISPDHDLVQPFYVYCNFSDPSNPVTEIGNDYLEEVPVDSCETYKCAEDLIQYSASLPQIVALIDSSSHCRQFIKLRCISSVLFHTGQFWGAWISRGGTDMHYWGGATSQRDRYCACGETGTCVDPTKTCNCDKNSSPETSDEGYLTDKNNLPVTGFRHGDTDAAGEQAWHTLGRLECSGKAR